MPSVKIKFRPSSLPDKEGVILYQIISDRRVKTITSRFRIYPYEWDAPNESIITHSASDARREYLYFIKHEIESDRDSLRNILKLFRNKDNFNLEEIFGHYKTNSCSRTVFPFIRQCIEELENSGKIKTASSYRTTLRSLSRFLDGDDISFTTFNGHLMKQYESWLKKRKVSMNSISFYMRVLRAVYNRAVNLGLTPQNMPFKNVYTGIDKTVKRAVGHDIISRLKKLDFGSCEGLSFGRDMFLFSLYTRGMSYVDMAGLKKENVKGEYLIYYRRKTGQRLSIKLENCMTDIIERYSSKTIGQERLLPIVSDTLVYSSALRLHNLRLKKISDILGLEESLSSYVARHTWASLAKRNGVPINIISEGMGHDNENTTRIYLAALDQSVIDHANKKLLSLF
ncbi:MAG: site-specific integrase [Rikenellaceae bacterium]|nr:site-specific integrase [Rikenellaceae bacterium]